MSLAFPVTVELADGFDMAEPCRAFDVPAADASDPPATSKAAANAIERCFFMNDLLAEGVALLTNAA